MGEFSPIHWLIVLLIIPPLYFLPSIVGRKKKNALGIFALNFFLGWTVAGWIIALIWASATDTPPTQVIVNQNQPPVLSSVFCINCGKYSPMGTKFCGMCGKPITS